MAELIEYKPDSNGEKKREIKSDSLVKFEATNLIHFSRLQCNTDLNLPPSNWLSNKFGGLKPHALHVPTTGFTSLRMANQFLDDLDVDVISDAENIKRLLKLPYQSNSVISMMIHRVGSTLLIDEFDIHKYLLKQAHDDWEWLKKFICSSMPEKDRSLLLKSRGASRDMLQKLNLQSKFLYYSAQDTDEGDAEKANSSRKPQPLNLVRPCLPEPDTLPKRGEHQYNRNVIWTFEKIKMLIGTDVPIFGNANRPVITLRLRDMAKPINVLTGIDYWLDNLMCNVPEVLMCYHLDGIVQKYELIKTEDLPDFSENSAFSPHLIRNVAQNILSFLKANATKPGHTYWLFKGKSDDIVKLYDLTTLCKDDLAEDKNPFTTPVAMLLYTVAKKIHSSNTTLAPKIAGRVKSLLEHCITLLPQEQHPQIASSSHYMLSDLFIPSDLDPKNPIFNTQDDSDSDEEEDGRDEGEDGTQTGLVVKEIKETFMESDHKSLKSSPPPLNSTDVLERCSIALNHVAAGLISASRINTSKDEKVKESEKARRLFEEQNPTMANPHQSIPLPYETLAESKTRMCDEKTILPLASAGVIESWRIHLKLILFEKACLIYATKAENAYSNACYGASLKYFYAALRCQHLIELHCPAIASQRKSCILGRIADCFYQFWKHQDQINNYATGFVVDSDVDRQIASEMYKENDDTEMELPEPTQDVVKLLETSSEYYEMALKCTNANDAKLEHMRRLGCVKNDLGNHLMLLAQADYENSDDSKLYSTYLMKAYDAFMRGITLFTAVNDTLNLSLMLANVGRFMRLRAHVALPGEKQNDINILKKFYPEAFRYYQEALTVMGNKKQNKDRHDFVAWDLSCATFNYAQALQDYEHDNIEYGSLEHLATEALHKALRHCDTETPGSRQILYTYRAGLIHHRLGSLHHKSFLKCQDETKQKNLLTLCRTQYEKAANYFKELHEPRDFIEVQLKRASLQEYLTDGAATPAAKQRHLLVTLQLFLDIRPLLDDVDEIKSNDSEMFKCLNLLEHGLQLCLKNLMMLVSKSKGKKETTKLEKFKKMFAASLRQPTQVELKELLEWLKITLDKIQTLHTSTTA